MYDNLEPLDEFLDLSPIGLTYYGQIEGQDLHSSERIENYSLEWCKTNPSTSKIINVIEEGLTNKVIIIGYEEKSKLKQLWNIFSRNIPKIIIMDPTKGSNILGYFSPGEKKLAVVLDKNVSLFGKSLKELPPILTHELTHFACNVKPNLTFKSCKNQLLKFYRNLTISIEPKSEKIPEEELLKVIKSLIFEMEVSHVEKRKMSTAFNIWKSYFEKNKEIDSEKTTVILFLPLIFWFLGNSRINRRELIKTMKKYYNSYKLLGINAVSFTLVGQEVFAPSEVLCISNQFNPSNEVIKLINSINMKNFSGPILT